MGNPPTHTGAYMRVGDILIDSDNKVYLVKAYLPKYGKRIWLLELETGRQFSILKSIARHWKPQENK